MPRPALFSTSNNLDGGGMTAKMASGNAYLKEAVLQERMENEKAAWSGSLQSCPRT